MGPNTRQASENSPTIMCAWKTRKTVTFPATSSYSPATNQASVHRVDGRRTRTGNILEGDTQSINANADGPEFENEKAKQPIRGTHSSISTQAVIHESAIDCSEKSRAVSSVMKSPTTVAIKIYQRGPQPLPATRQRILFYHKNDPYYGFTNFSPHSVIYKDKEYPTSEHLFQSLKFQDHNPDLAEHIRIYSEKPSIALSEARRYQHEVRPDWKQVNIEKMDETLYHKFTQNRNLLTELLGTGDAELIENSDRDAFWGVGPDGKGRNELGKCLMRLRTALRLGKWK